MTYNTDIMIKKAKTEIQGELKNQKKFKEIKKIKKDLKSEKSEKRET